MDVYIFFQKKCDQSAGLLAQLEMARTIQKLDLVRPPYPIRVPDEIKMIKSN
jgi:hypothetical protein